MTVRSTSKAQAFGHPRGLMVLATTELWERFSFYGMQALLLLYMTKYLLLPEHARNVLGLGAYRAGLAHIVGPMSDLAFAAQTYGIYSGLIYGTSLIGAWLGDRVLGKTRTISLGCVLMAAGHLTMASEHLFLAALLMIALGSGGVIGNMFAQVGALYDADDHRRTRAFGIYLITLNIGALASPLIIGTLGEKVGWRYGFGVAGVGMLIALATYLLGRRHLPPDRVRQRGATPKLTPKEWRKVTGLLLLFAPYILYSAAVLQSYAVMYVWADKAVNRVIFGWEVPVTWIGVADGLFTITGVIVANSIWRALDKRHREPGELVKMTIGYLGVGLAFMFAAAVASLPVVPVVLWLAFYLIMDLGVGWAEPTLQSLISRDSPPSVVAMMMSICKATTMVAFFFLGWCGRFYEPMGPVMFWVFTGAQALIAAGLLVVFRPQLRRLLEPGEPGEPLTAGA